MGDTTEDDDVLAVLPAVQRVVASRVRDAATAEDVVQETLARVLAARDRLDAGSLRPYAIVTARNVVADLGRAAGRPIHRALDLRTPPDPGDLVVADEEHRSLAIALDRLPAAQRDELVAHEVEGATTADLADRRGTSPGAIAVRLAAARARLRVEYVLALRGIAELPTPQCRAVLTALSAGDRRRQRALDAGGHLLDCATCSSLGAPLVERRRRLAVLLPFALLLRKAKEHPAVTTATAGVAAAAIAATVLLQPDPTPAPTLGPATTTTVPATVTALVPVVVEDGTVVEVTADEEFVVDVRPGERWSVRLTETGDESPVTIRPGQRVSFTGTVVGDHLEVPAADIVVR